MNIARCSPKSVTNVSGVEYACLLQPRILSFSVSDSSRLNFLHVPICVIKLGNMSTGSEASVWLDVWDLLSCCVNLGGGQH